MENKKKLPRGLRNNNPLNIRRSTSKWIGLVESLDGVIDKEFCQFDNLYLGWRAAFLLLIKYITAYKCNTIEKIITRWAPPSENKTEKYIRGVCLYTGLSKDESIAFNIDGVTQILSIATAMCEIENGVDFNPLNKRFYRLSQLAGFYLAIRRYPSKRKVLSYTRNMLEGRLSIWFPWGVGVLNFLKALEDWHYGERLTLEDW